MSRFLALDPDPSGPLIASASVSRGAVTLDRVLAWPDGEPPASPAALGAALKAVLKEAGIAPAPLLVCLPRDKIVLKDVRHPKAPPQQEPMVVKFQAKKELTGSPDDMLMDYLPVPAPTGADDCRATVVFVKKQVYGDILMMCDAAGLKLAAVTPRPFAVAAAYRRAVATAAAHPPEHPGDPVAVLTLSERGGEFVVVHGAQVPFSRTLSPAALTSEAALLGEVKRGIAMYATQYPGAAVQAVYMTEGGSGGRSWAGRLQTSLPIPVHPFDPTAGVESGISDADRGRFVGAVGLLAARAESDRLPINFVTPRSPKAEPSKARTGLLVGLLAAVLIVCVGGGFAYVTLQRKQREIDALQSELGTISRSQDSVAYDKKRLTAVEDLLRHQMSPQDFLYDITVEFPTIDPDKMQLVDFQVKVRKTPAARPGGPAAPGGPKGPTPAPGAPPPKGGPTPAGTGTLGGAAPPKAEEKPPVADLTLTILAKDSADVLKLEDALKRDARHFAKVRNSIKGSLAGSGDKTQYELTAEILQWPPTEFTRKLNAAFPKKPDPLPEEPKKEKDPDADPPAEEPKKPKDPPAEEPKKPKDNTPIDPNFDPFNPPPAFDTLNNGGGAP